MNDDELREVLRAPDGIDPLDPANVIAGAHRRRRKRGMAVGGAAAVAVLAVVAVSVIAGTRPSGSPVVEQPTPSVSTPKATRTTPQGPNVATLVAQCKAELRVHDLALGPKTAKQALLSSADGSLIVIADGKNWTACDTGYRQVGGSVRMSARSPGPIRRPATSDADAFAVANNVVTRAGKDFDYYWAAGLLPVGVTKVSYSFPGGSSVDAVVSGKYWLMRHSVPMAGPETTPSPERVEVRLLAADGAVLKKFKLQPGEQTCEQISHGC
ncbi:hypothetical protein [Kribbella catacumbae]|uniref:hypothetical protein n=1 Tax=Kribbella catacumbae TaxID=460086 RepID=UPI0003751E25|nr:hypothetical protein [Kribbella catacumbae]